MTRLLGTGLFLCLLTACAQPPPEPVTAEPAPAPVVAPAPEPSRLLTAGTASIPVIMYHDVVTESEVWFDLSLAGFTAQMDRLAAAGATPVSLDDVVTHLRDGAPVPDKPIALTFDQGTPGLYEHVYPLLKARGWPATYFVHTGYVGRPSATKDHVTWDQLREMEASGLIDVQPMSVTFPEFLGQLDDAALQAEIGDSVAAVERELGHPARYFAYPYGNGDERVARALAAAGIEAAWNEVRAPNAAPADRLFLPRYAPKRLDEAMACWDHPAPAVHLRPLDVAPGKPDGEFDWLTGAWPQPGDAKRLRLGETSWPVPHVLLAGGVFQPLADANELAWQGRPLLVGNQQQVVLATYRRWMSAPGHVYASCDSLRVLLDPANYAVLGRDWLRRGGQDAGGDADWTDPVIVAVDEGRLGWARVGGSATSAKLRAKLSEVDHAVVLSGE